MVAIYTYVQSWLLNHNELSFRHSEKLIAAHSQHKGKFPRREQFKNVRWMNWAAESFTHVQKSVTLLIESKSRKWPTNCNLETKKPASHCNKSQTTYCSRCNCQVTRQKFQQHTCSCLQTEHVWQCSFFQLWDGQHTPICYRCAQNILKNPAGSRSCQGKRGKVPKIFLFPCGILVLQKFLLNLLKTILKIPVTTKPSEKKHCEGCCDKVNACNQQLKYTNPMFM